jgi:hypothetical protein
MRRVVLSVIAVFWVAAMASAAADAAAVQANNDELVPTGKGWGERPAPGPGPGQGMGQGHGDPQGQARAARPRSTNGIGYHGGPVIITPNIYYIWYGNWSNNTAPSILEDLARNIGGSPYFNINTTYYDGAGRNVQNAVKFPVSSTSDSYSQGTALSDAGVQAVVAHAISTGHLPMDANGVYFVLTSSDVNETSGFCTQYCGWHTHANISGLGDVKYSFVGNPDRCPNACAAQTTGPNGNAGADGMASIIAHELEEATTDPDLNAWYDSRGYENADKCAWTFGTTYSANGAKANMKLGTRDYLIQQNWVNASGGSCALRY